MLYRNSIYCTVLLVWIYDYMNNSSVFYLHLPADQERSPTAKASTTVCLTEAKFPSHRATPHKLYIYNCLKGKSPNSICSHGLENWSNHIKWFAQCRTVGSSPWLPTMSSNLHRSKWLQTVVGAKFVQETSVDRCAHCPQCKGKFHCLLLLFPFLHYLPPASTFTAVTVRAPVEMCFRLRRGSW